MRSYRSHSSKARREERYIAAGLLAIVLMVWVPVLLSITGATR